MNRYDIAKALMGRLESGLHIKGSWPNVASPVAMRRPYYEVEFPAFDRDTIALDGKIMRETGRMAVLVVVEEGTGERDAYEIAGTIDRLFPASERIPVVGGVITIVRPCDIRGGYPDGPDWRVPVIVQYSATRIGQ